MNIAPLSVVGRLQIKAIRGDGVLGDTAVDDIRLLPGACNCKNLSTFEGKLGHTVNDLK